MKRDEKVEYARSVFLNVRRPHIKSGIRYKNSDMHNSRVNKKDQEFIKDNIQQEKKQSIKTTNNASYFILMLLIFLICHTMISMLLMCS
jgi:hypothetical protein